MSAEIDYYGIELAIKALIEDQVTPSDVGADKLFVEVEEQFNLIADKTPYVHIRLIDYDMPEDGDDGPKIGGSTPYSTFLNFEMWCYQFGFDDRETQKLTYKLVQKIKQVLKGNITLGDNVLILVFRGGQFDSGQDQDENGFFKGISIEFKVEVRE